jgi:hypothetical protein
MDPQPPEGPTTPDPATPPPSTGTPPAPSAATPPVDTHTHTHDVPNAPAYNALVGDWPTKATDAVETLVALLRDKTVRPATLIARVVIFSIIIFAAAVTTVTLLAITLIRVLTIYVFDGRVWAADLLVGLLFSAGGVVAWMQRTQPLVEVPE